MLCVSDASSYKAIAHIIDSHGGRIEAGGLMKILGFHFLGKPTIHAHVDALRKRFRRRYWCLYHLRRAGFDDEELARVYRTVILPLADYCAIVYHSMLTDEQDQIVECV